MVGRLLTATLWVTAWLSLRPVWSVTIDGGRRDRHGSDGTFADEALRPSLREEALARQRPDVHQSDRSLVDAASLMQVEGVNAKELPVPGTGGLRDRSVQLLGEQLDRLILELRALNRSVPEHKVAPAYAFPRQHVATANRARGRTRADVGGSLAAGDMSAVGEFLLEGGIGPSILILTAALVLSLVNVGPGVRKTSPQWRDVLSMLGPESHRLKPKRASPAISEWDATVATFSTLVGTGLLAMPYAFSLAGMIAVPIMVLFVCSLAYTAQLMARALETQAGRDGPECLLADRQPRSWGLLVSRAFGAKAQRAIDLFLVVELWSYLLNSLLTAAMNLSQCFDEISVGLGALLCALVAFALTFVPSRLLMKVNALANLVFLACCLMCVTTGLLLPASERLASSSEVRLMKPHGILAAAGILVFSPAAHSFYPEIMQRMENPSKYPSCAARSYVAAGVLYVAFGAVGYYLFGNAAQVSAVRNIGASRALEALPGLAWMGTAAAVGMAVKMVATLPLVLQPLTSTLKSVIQTSGLGFKVSETLWEVSVVPFLLATTAVVATCLADDMALLLSLIGSVFCMNIGFVMPVLCYWKLEGGPVSGIQRTIFLGLLAMGVIFAVLGLITAAGF